MTGHRIVEQEGEADDRLTGGAGDQLGPGIVDADAVDDLAAERVAEGAASFAGVVVVATVT